MKQSISKIEKNVPTRIPIISCAMQDMWGIRVGTLHERVDGHKRKSSSIYKHYHLQHNDQIPQRFLEWFEVLAKCTNKFDCLIHEMLFIRKLKPELNVQTDSIRTKVFV